MKNSLERELIILLVDRYKKNKERCLELLNMPLDWEYVLGYLTYNRVAGVAYQTILECNPYEDNINREFRLGLFLIHNIQTQRTESFQKYIVQIGNKLEQYNIPHAFLKGSILANSIYEKGSRISNDIDLLISEEYLDKASKALKEIHFIQGTYDISSNSVIPASRREILHCRMNFGELMSFIRVVDDPGMNMILADVNFSMEADAISQKKSVEKYLSNLSYYSIGENKVLSLEIEYFIAHLCVHFYKEATDLRWIEKQRDMCLYKILDIYEVFNSKAISINYEKLRVLIEEEGIYSEVYYTLKVVANVFDHFEDDVKVKTLLQQCATKVDDEIMYHVRDAKEPMVRYSLKMDMKERIFALDKIKKLERITEEM